MIELYSIKDSDTYNDIRSDYINFLKVGVKDKLITNEILEKNSDLFNSEEQPLCWISLAVVQYDYGRLEENVKLKALLYLNKNIKIKEYKQIIDKLNSQLPPKKKVSKIKMCEPLWNIGDILSYKIKCAESKWNDKYVIFHVVGIGETRIGSLPKNKYSDKHCILKIYSWVGDKIENIDEIKKCEYISEKRIIGNVFEPVKYIVSSSTKKEKLEQLENVTVIGNEIEKIEIDNNICYGSFINLTKNVKHICALLDRNI